MGKTSALSDFERGILHTTVSRVYREWYDEQRTSSQRQTCGRKQLIDERGRRRMARMVQANRRATNGAVQQCCAEPHLGNAQVIEKLQWARDHQHWTIEELKNIAWNMTVSSVNLRGLRSSQTATL